MVGQKPGYLYPRLCVSSYFNDDCSTHCKSICYRPGYWKFSFPTALIFSEPGMESTSFIGITFIYRTFLSCKRSRYCHCALFPCRVWPDDGVPLGMAMGKIDLSSWSFSLWYLGGVIIAWIAIFFLTRLLTKENIILSGKGG